jgi:cell division protein FtsI/penicillin-binding protein 2
MNENAYTWRYSSLGLIIFLLPVLVTLQLVRIQINPGWVKEVMEFGERFEKEAQFIDPPRGQILDRKGNLLAGNQIVYEVGIDLPKVVDPRSIATVLSSILDIDYEDVYSAASLEASDRAVYAVVADYLPQEKIDKLNIFIEQLDSEAIASPEKGLFNLAGIVMKPHLGRLYPERMIGSNFMGFSHVPNVGYFGVEEQYNDILSRPRETIWVPVNPLLAEEQTDVPSGSSLILTVDRAVQKSMEELVDEAVVESGSDSATIVVLNPKNGEIMALATTPRMDLNDISEYKNLFTQGIPYNRAIGQDYEPGSVFKVLTMAAALDAGAVTPETQFVDTGVIEVGGLRIYNWDSGAWGPQSMLGCLQHSLNVCLAWVSTQMGYENFYPYMKAFGIGQLTGVDLAWEVSGRLKIPGDGDWYEADLGTNAFGQGISATPLQMAVAISALANHGKIMTPHIVKAIVNEGYLRELGTSVMRVPIKPETANTITEMLARSLEIEASDALVTGYRVAGKTGTAEIPTPYGYTTNETNASFVGWGPADDPQFLIYIWLERPSVSPWGSVVASPVFREAVERLVVLIDLPPDDIRHQLDPNSQ